MTKNASWRALSGAVAVVVLSINFAFAQNSVADFYRGKQVRIIVGFAAGGNSGLYGDVLGRHMGNRDHQQDGGVRTLAWQQAGAVQRARV